MSHIYDSPEDPETPYEDSEALAELSEISQPAPVANKGGVLAAC